MTRKKPEASDEVKNIDTKRAQLIVLLKRQDGASLAEMIDATDWQAHTVRAALTGLRKNAMTIESEKADGVRRYRIVEAAT